MEVLCEECGEPVHKKFILDFDTRKETILLICLSCGNLSEKPVKKKVG